MILNYIKTVLLIGFVEFLLFITMIFFVMTDEPVGLIGKTIGWIFKYIAGFPMVLVNSEYPFFINSSSPPNYMIPLIIINLLIQGAIIFYIRRLIKN